MKGRLTKPNIVQFFSSKKRLIPVGVALILLLSSVGYSLASGQVVDLSKNEENVVVRGTQAHGYLSEISASGDFTGDSISDMLLGAAGNNHNGSFSGAAYLIPGGKNIPAAQDISKAVLTLYGANTNDILGHSAAIGDIDGDNHPDLVVGADGTNNLQGSVYVIAGGITLPATIDLAKTPNATELTINGPASGARFGRAVAVGDVNGDGIRDIIVGAYTYSPGGRAEAGAVYVFFGSTAYHGKHTTLAASQANLIIYGQAGATAAMNPANASALFPDETSSPTATIGDRLGRSIAVGDVNKDGIPDIIVGAYGASAAAGKTYVFYGSRTLPATIDLSANPAAANVTLTGVHAGDESGFYVAAGDLNGDGYADILSSAYLSQGYNNATGPETGTVYAVYGGPSLAATISLTNANVTVYGAAAGDRLGRSITAGDINTDGFADMVMGASRASPGGRTNAGEVFVIFGGKSIPASIQLSSGSANIQILGAQGGMLNGSICDDEQKAINADCSDETGHSVAVGDVNGDHGVDIIAGAVFANNGSLADTGAAYVIYGVGVGKNHSLYLPLVNRTTPGQ